MGHPLLVRLAIGGAGLAGCLAILSGVARAADTADYGQRPIIVSSTMPVLAPNLSGTMTIPVKPERYLDGWERARRDDSADPRMQALIAPARGLSRDQQISYVQGAVFQRIHWRSDATEWGYHDYWASAAETLQHGYGDEEDRAIVKMQALRALGFPTRDLYLTMGRDKVDGPITVLIVRLGERYYVLDDTGGAPFTTDRRPEFSPMLTFGYGGFWIHGYPYVPGAPRNRTRVIVAAARSAFAAH
ncbi:MAG TPA: transglutaminase-like cysteine peptidase [Sphingomicrobium sp.]|nr:transglutaminase-like cysteine peptidase [Sphingomicrobium sp.]